MKVDNLGNLPCIERVPGWMKQEKKTYKTKPICRRLGHSWSRLGIRQAQSLGRLLVPKHIAAAVICPIKYDTLNNEVNTGRSLG